MRILVVSQHYLPQPMANAEVIGALCRELARRGHDVAVVCPFRESEPVTGVTVHRARSFVATNRGSRLGRALEYLSFSLAAAATCMQVRRPDVVVVPSPPPTLGLVGLAIARARRAPLVYNVQDLYPEVAETTGAIRSRLVLEVLRRLMGVVYRGAAAVVVIDPRFVAPLQARAPGARVRSVRNGIDLQPFAGASSSPELLARLGVPSGAPVVMYAGNVGRSQDLDAVVEATGRVGAHFVIHGGGAALGDLCAELGRSGADHVHLSPFAPRAQLGTVFASADVHVVPLKAGIARSSLPSKLLSIFAAGRPAVLVADVDSPATAVLDEAGGGWWVPAGDDDALDGALAEAIGNPEEARRRGQHARRWVHEHASAARSAHELEAVLLELTDGVHR